MEGLLSTEPTPSSLYFIFIYFHFLINEAEISRPGQRQRMLYKHLCHSLIIINRPGVAGAVLKSPLSLIDLLVEPSFSLNIFQTLLIPNQKSWNFERMFIPHYVSCVMCHMSHVTCHLLQVTYHMLFFLFNFFIYINEWAGWWRVCLIKWVVFCENIFTEPPRPNGWRWCFQS